MNIKSYTKQEIIDNLNIKYINEATENLHGYNFVGIDPGYHNLISLCDYKHNKLRYTLSQYNVESQRKKYKNKICRINKKKKRTKDENIKYKKYHKIINKHFNLYLGRLCVKIRQTFGKKCVLCFGDGGYNEFNYKILKFLITKYKCYLINEHNTTKLCPICKNKTFYMGRMKGTKQIKKYSRVYNKKIRGLKFCEKCNIMYNRDNVACINIMIKSIKEYKKINLHNQNELVPEMVNFEELNNVLKRRFKSSSV